MKLALRMVAALTLLTSMVHAESVNSETERAAASLGAQMSSQIAFEKGKADLKAEELAELKAVVDQAKTGGQKIDEIKVISWADREYPAEGTTAPNQQVKLAEARAKGIKDYLKKEFKVSDVAVYNMAKRPNALQELFNTQTAKVKNSMETSGAAPTSKEDTGLFGLKGKTSEALVLVYTEKK